MGHEKPQALMFDLHGLARDLYTDFPGEEVSQPEIVVASHIDGPGSPLDQGSQLMQNPMVPSRHSVLVLEPDVEEIAQHVEESSILGNMAKEGDKPLLFCLFSTGMVLSQVSIGDKIDFFVFGQDSPPYVGEPYRG
jgi:hypothetical protein